MANGVVEHGANMARGQPLSIRPELIRWVRRSAGLSVEDAARRVRVATAVFAGWEADGARRTPRQIEALADAFKRPVASFFLPAPPPELPLPRDFRRPVDGLAAASFATRLAIRRARRLQRSSAELGVALGETAAAAPLTLPLRITDDPEVGGSRARAALGLTDEIQASWGGDSSRALREARRMLEASGGLVLQFAMDPAECSGFSLAGAPAVIALNRKESPSRRLFTLGHEWGHILLGQPGLCEIDDTAERGQDAAEVFCNAFAAALLVPLETLRSDVGSPATGTIDDILERGVHRFAVSRHVVLRRLLTAGIVDHKAYRQKLAAWQAASRPVTPKAKGGTPPYRRALSDLGEGLVSRVVAAHERGFVGDAELTSLLGLRLKHVPRPLEPFKREEFRF